jgi:hypothetical protein
LISSSLNNIRPIFENPSSTPGSRRKSNFSSF